MHCHIVIATWLPDAGWGEGKPDAPGWQYMFCEDLWYSASFADSELTHWMPLPQKPEKNNV